MIESNQNLPEISIIIPVYNSQSYLDTCITSILKQSFQNFEIICIDDGSSDTSLKILHDFATNDSRICVLSQEKNMGPASARNLGILKARGTYCIFCDSDDAYPPYALERLLRTAQSAHVSVCGGNILFMDHAMQHIHGVNDCVTCTQFGKTAVVSPLSYFPLWLPVYHQRYLIARELIQKYGITYPDLRLGEDPPFLAHVFCVAKNIAVIPDVVYYYRGASAHKGKNQSPAAMYDYMQHISMTYNIYLQYGYTNIANFFLAQTFENLSYFKNWLVFSHTKRQLVRAQILSLAKKLPQEAYSQDYVPYPVRGEKVQQMICHLNKGVYWYMARVFIKKILAILGR